MPGAGRLTLANLLEMGLVQPGDKWFIERRGGESAVAEVTEAGTLRIAGKDYASPSTAAGAVLGAVTNGWKRWKFDDGDARVFVDTLRQRGAVRD